MSVNKQGLDWKLIKKWNEERIAVWQAELEGLTTGPDRAHQLRGMIHALREQIEEVEPTPTPEVKEPDYDR